MTRRNAIISLVLVLMVILTNKLLSLLDRLSFSKHNKRPIEFENRVAEIAEIIIPATKTPGAKDANVSKYISNVFDNCLSERDKRTILLGLDDVDRYSIKRYSLSFDACDKRSKQEVMQYFESSSSFSKPLINKIKNKLFGPSFFELIRNLTVSGYCTSELGATMGLAYDSIPGSFIPCTFYQPNQRSWATQ